MTLQIVDNEAIFDNFPTLQFKIVHGNIVSKSTFYQVAIKHTIKARSCYFLVKKLFVLKFIRKNMVKGRKCTESAASVQKIDHLNIINNFKTIINSTAIFISTHLVQKKYTTGINTRSNEKQRHTLLEWEVKTPFWKRFKLIKRTVFYKNCSIFIVSMVKMHEEMRKLIAIIHSMCRNMDENSTICANLQNTFCREIIVGNTWLIIVDWAQTRTKFTHLHSFVKIDSTDEFSEVILFETLIGRFRYIISA